MPARSFCSNCRGFCLVLLSLCGVTICGGTAARLEALPAESPAADVGELIAAGGRALESGDLETAAARFGAAVAEDPEAALAWMGLGEVAARRDRLLEALRHARAAERLAPDEPEVVYAVSRHLARLGRYEEALRALERVRELQPERPEAYLLATELLRGTGDSEAAIRVVEAGLAAGLEDSRLAEEHALLLLTAGRTDEALAVASAAAERWPQSGGVKGSLGLALAAIPERRHEAVGWLAAALEAGVASPDRIHLELATLVQESDPERALEHLHAAAALRPNSSEVHYRLGTALRNHGDLEGAREALGRYQELEQAEQQATRASRDAGTRFNEAQSLANENRLAEALAAIDALLADAPSEDRALALRGKVLFSMGRGEEALAAVAAARTAEPRQVEYHYLEGLFLLQLGRAAEAELPLRRAVALDARLADGHALLGMALSSLERYEEAVGSFERALAAGAEGRSLRLGFAEALRGAGRLEESEKQMAAYRRLAER